MENINFTFFIYTLKNTVVWNEVDGRLTPSIKKIKTHTNTQTISAQTEEDAYRRVTLKSQEWGECQPF